MFGLLLDYSLVVISPWVAAAVIAASPIPYVSPGVASPATGAILVAIALVLRTPKPSSAGIATGLVWLAAGSRPEYIWLAVLCSGASLIWLVIRVVTHFKGSSRSVPLKDILSVVSGSAVVPLALVLLHGSFLNTDGRQFVAFGQHFAGRHANASEDRLLDYPAIVDRTFPGASGVGSALVTNPVAFIQHVFSNVVDLRVAFFQNTLGFSANGFANQLMGPIMLAGLIASLFFALRAYFQRASLARLRNTWTTARRSQVVIWVLVLAAIAAPPLIVAPRLHYLLVPACLMVLGIVIVIRRTVGDSGQIFAVFFVLFGLFAAQTTQLAIHRVSSPPALATSAQQMAESDTQWRLIGPPRLALYVPDLTVVTTKNPNPRLREKFSTQYLSPGKSETFTQYLNRAGVNAVLIDRRLQPSYRSLPGVDEFIADPTKHGFTRLFPKSPVWVRTPAGGESAPELQSESAVPQLDSDSESGVVAPREGAEAQP